jgi:integrase
LCDCCPTKRHATEGNTGTKSIQARQHAGAKYQRVFDGRKARIRRLWKRGDTFYAPLLIEDAITGKKLVRRVRWRTRTILRFSVAEAVKVMRWLQVTRDKETTLKLDPKRTPIFSEYADAYLRHFEMLKDAKRPATLRVEKVCINRWKEYLGETRLRAISKSLVNGFMAQRQSEGVSGRTVNLEIVVLRNVLKKAIDDGLLSSMSIEGIKWLKHTPAKRELLTHEQIESVCAKAIEVSRITGQQVADFIKLSCYSGGRMSETLRLKWSDVDFDSGQVCFGSDGLAKNHRSRSVDFNGALRSHLEDMQERRQPDSEFLFPFFKRGEEDQSTKSFNMTIRKARDAAGVPHFHAHLCRHYFASMTLIAGCDVQTVSSWLGHTDGGALLCCTYAHLLNQHKKAQATRVVFTPAVLPAVAKAS